MTLKKYELMSEGCSVSETNMASADFHIMQMRHVLYYCNQKK
jgi:hypothetical protein